MNPTSVVKLPDLSEQGTLGISFLKRFWAKTKIERAGQISDYSNQENQYLNPLLNVLGIGLEPTLQYLYGEAPSFALFEEWINVNGNYNKSVIELFNQVISEEQSAKQNFQIDNPVLTAEDLAFWEENGYVILRQAVSTADCEATVDLIYQHIGAKEEDPSTWYQDHPAKQGIMIQLFQHPQLNKNRLNAKIRTAYQQIWQRSDLMVSMDRVSFNPPETEHYQFPGPNLHWDVSLKQPIPLGVQGLLYLTDTSASQGAFTCVPGFQHKIGRWLQELPVDANPRAQDLIALGAQPIVAKAGDFIIWHHALPHGSAPNRASSPRIVQYINWQSLNLDLQTEWI